MDFFATQERSRRTTRLLVLFFGLAFVTVALATAIVISFFLGAYFDDDTGRPITSLTSLLDTHGRTLLAAGLIVLHVMVLASLYRSATLGRGGAQVARMLGGTEVRGEDQDPAHRRLVNVVEEMAIASGLPVPEIYVLEQEAGINAFAAGLSESDAAVAVTRGALDRLQRAELQGVIAHEFSHILNGDMRLNQRLIGFSYGILVLSLAGRWLLRSRRGYRSRSGRGAGFVIAIGLALTVIGAIGVLLSRIIKAAVSRQREVLADASAVQFTREPSALAGALKKIGGYTAKFAAVDDEEVAHMLFERKTTLFGRMFATHPPLLERIRALDPSFQPADYETRAEAMPLEPATHGELTSSLVSEATTTDVQTTLVDVLAHTGQIEAAAIGQAILRALPEELYHAAHDQASCILLILAWTLAGDEPTQARQRQLIQSQLGAGRAGLVMRLHADLMRLERGFWLPLLELAIPAIKQRPPEQLQYLFELVGRLLATRDTERLFDFVLLRLLASYVGQSLPQRSLWSAKLDAKHASAHLLAVVAAYGHDTATAARAAYQAGLEVLGHGIELSPNFEQLPQIRNLAILDAALSRLTKLAPRAKRRLLHATAATIDHDRATEVEEIELFRAIGAVLGCPSPPPLSIIESDR